MTDDTLTAAVARLREAARCRDTDLLWGRDPAVILAALEAAQKDARRWNRLCLLWAASTHLALTQCHDGRWAIDQIEAVDEPFCSLIGDTQDAAIDAATKESGDDK